jgi:hypothetical protein
MATYKDQHNYICEIVNQGFVESKKGTPGFALVVIPRAEICPNTNQQIECPQYERQLTLWITDKTAERVSAHLRSLGFEGGSFAQLDPDRSGHHSFIGQEVVLNCKHEVDQNDSSKVYDKFEFPFVGSAIDVENDSKVASKLDALFGKTLKATAAQPKPQPQLQTVSSPNQAFDEAVDDGIPF